MQILRIDVRILRIDVRILRTDVRILRTDVRILRTDVRLKPASAETFLARAQGIKTFIKTFITTATLRACVRNARARIETEALRAAVVAVKLKNLF
jgi:hypothetical protein